MEGYGSSLKEGMARRRSESYVEKASHAGDGVRDGPADCNIDGGCAYGHRDGGAAFGPRVGESDAHPMRRSAGMRTGSAGTRVRFALGMSLAMLLASPLCAQRIQGIVLDEFSHTPLEGADVSLLGTKGKVTGRATTGTDGRFAMTIRKFGAYAIEVHALGYAPYTTRVFVADTSQQVSATVNLAPAPIALEGLTVETTAIQRALERVGFYRREKAGFGSFLTATQIEERAVSRITDALYGLPGVRVACDPSGVDCDVTMRGAPVYCAPPTGEAASSAAASGAATSGGAATSCNAKTCYPSVYLDGDMIRRGGQTPAGQISTAGWWAELVSPYDVAAIEVYPHAAGLPAFASGTDSPCGAILIWTKTH